MVRFYIQKTIVLIMLLFVSVAAESKERPVINLLTWWNYITPNIISYVENRCNIRLSVDEYYSNTELFDRFKLNDYSVVIYSDTIHKSFSKEYQHPNYNLQQYVKDSYNIHISNLLSRYEKNTVFFQLSLTGFLWNPKNIYLNKNQNIKEIFSNAKGKIVILLDDYTEIINLLEKAGVNPKKNRYKGMLLLASMLNNTTPIISNSLGHIYDNSDFAVSYSWSGEALNAIAHSQEPLEFMIHPKLSYWSSDLISLIRKSKASICVARTLASKKILQQVSREFYYFSPYGPITFPNNQSLNDTYDKFYKNFNKYNEINRLDGSSIDFIENAWSELKMRIGPEHQNNG